MPVMSNTSPILNHELQPGICNHELHELLVGMDRVFFLLKLHHYGVAMIDLDKRKLETDQQNA